MKNIILTWLVMLGAFCSTASAMTQPLMVLINYSSVPLTLSIKQTGPNALKACGVVFKGCVPNTGAPVSVPRNSGQVKLFGDVNTAKNSAAGFPTVMHKGKTTTINSPGYWIFTDTGVHKSLLDYYPVFYNKAWTLWTVGSGGYDPSKVPKTF